MKLLDLRGYRNIADDNILKFLKNSCTIKHLLLPIISILSYITLDAITANCREIETVCLNFGSYTTSSTSTTTTNNINSITKAALMEVVLKCEKLTHVSFFTHLPKVVQLELEKR